MVSEDDSIDAVSQSLSTLSANMALNNKALAQGASSLAKWADQTGKAGKNWTTFSRLTSGTGIWKLQNYIRGGLELLGKWAESTEGAVKAQTKQEKSLADTIQGVRKIGVEYTALSDVVKNHTSKTDDLLKAEKLYKENRKKNRDLHKKTLTDNKEHQAALKQVAALTKSMVEAEGVLEQTNQSKSMTMQAKTKELKLLHDTELKSIAALEKAKASVALTEAAAIKQKKEIFTVEKERYEQEIKSINKLATYTDTQIAALESTNEFNQAIIQGKTDAEAYAESFNAIGVNVKKNQKEYDVFAKKQEAVAKFNKQMGSDAGILEAGLSLGEEEEKFKSDMKGEDSLKTKIGKKIKGVDDGKGGKEGGLVGAAKKASGGIGSFWKLAKSSTLRKQFLTSTAAGVKFRKKVMGFQKFMKPVLNMAFKFLIFGILGMMALLAIAKVAYDVIGIMGEFGIFDDMKEIFLAGIDILTSVFGIIGSFMSGDFTTMFAYMGTIISSLMTIGLNIMQVVIKGVFAVVVGIFYSIIDFLDYLIFQGGWSVVFPALLKLGMLLLGIYFVRYLVMQGLLLLGIYALPIILGIIIAGLLTAMVIKLYREIDRIWSPVKGVMEDIRDYFTDDPDSGWWDTKIAPAIGLHKGGMTHGNMNLVGEKGPELVKLPAGSRVYSNSQSKSMSEGSTVVNNYITINAKDTSDQELRRIADKIGNMVNNKINRTTSSRTFG